MSFEVLWIALWWEPYINQIRWIVYISDDISQDSVANVTNEICGVFNKADRKTFGLIYHKTSPISNESTKKAMV